MGAEIDSLRLDDFAATKRETATCRAISAHHETAAATSRCAAAPTPETAPNRPAARGRRRRKPHRGNHGDDRHPQREPPAPSRT